MKFALLALFTAAATSFPAVAYAENAELAKAELFLGQLKYADADRALAAALQVPGNDRPTLLRILELSGTVAATLRQPERANTYFRRLLVLDPSFKLSGESTPRVSTAFLEAKGWVAERQPLTFTALPPVVVGGNVERIEVQVTSDPLGMAKNVRFHLRPLEGTWAPQHSPLEGKLARALVAAPAVEWWAELLGENDAVLAELGLPGQPMAATAKVAPPPIPPAPPPQVSGPLPTSEGSPGLRVAAIASWVGAAAAIGTGAYFGSRSASGRRQLEGVARDEDGAVTGLTQVQAIALEKRVKSDAVAANVFLGTAAGLAVAGGVFWWLGNRVVVAPTGDGVAVAGTLP